METSALPYSCLPAVSLSTTQVNAVPIGVLMPLTYRFTFVRRVLRRGSAFSVEECRFPHLKYPYLLRATHLELNSKFGDDCAVESEDDLNASTFETYVYLVKTGARWTERCDARCEPQQPSELIFDKSTVAFTVSVITALHETVTDPPPSPENTASSTPTVSNITTSALEPSRTKVDANQQTTTWQTGASYTFVGALGVGILVTAIAVFAKRRPRLTEFPLFSAKNKSLNQS